MLETAPNTGRKLTTSQDLGRKLTASQVILLAAYDLFLTNDGKEFSEWDLTLAAWALDRFRFGLRGHANIYPDHKRVSMEIMGQKSSNPVNQGYFEKLRPNYYKLTQFGADAARKLREPVHVPNTVSISLLSVDNRYVIPDYVVHPSFKMWLQNPEEPREWVDAARFIYHGGMTVAGSTIFTAAQALETIKTHAQACLDFCSLHSCDSVTYCTGYIKVDISIKDIAELLDFIQALKYRFPECRQALDYRADGDESFLEKKVAIPCTLLPH